MKGRKQLSANELKKKIEDNIQDEYSFPLKNLKKTIKKIILENEPMTVYVFTSLLYDYWRMDKEEKEDFQELIQNW